MADSTVTLNAGTGGASAAVFLDSLNEVHQKVILELQAGASDPVKVGSANPIPTTDNVATFGGTAVSLGSKTSAASMPVVIASDQSAVPALQSGAWNVTLDAGTAAIGSITNTAFGATQSGAWTVAATQSGSWSVTIGAGTAAIGSITNTAFGATQSGTWNVGLSAGTNAIGSITNTSFAATQSGTWNVGLSAGTNAIGSITNTSFAATQSGTWDVGLTAGTNHVGETNLNPVSGQGWASAYSGSIGATATAVKAASGTLGGWYIYNANASVAYVQIFDAATGSVTLGTTAPKMSIGIPPGGAANLELANGLAFATAITIAVTTTRAGAVSPASTVDINMWYT